MSQDEKNNGHENQESDRGKEPIQYVQVTPYGYPPEEDEIDLADLFAVLYQRKKLIAAVTVLFVLLAFGASQMMTKKYNVSTILEIGKISRGDSLVDVESSSAVSNKISAFSKAIAGEMSEEVETMGFSVKNDLNIDAPRDGNIVTVGVTAPEFATKNALVLLSGINNQLIMDHDRIFDQIERTIKREITKEKIEIDNLDVEIKNLLKKNSELKRQYEERAKEQENVIKSLESTIENTRNQKALAIEKITLLRKEQEDLEERIAEAEERYKNLLNYKLRSNEEAKGIDAVGMMLFNSEILQTQNYLSKLRDRLILGIPQAIGQLQVDVEDFDNTLANLHEEKTLEQKRLANLRPELNEKIEEIEGKIKVLEGEKRQKESKIEDLESSLQKMIKTSVIVEPNISGNPVSPNVKLIVALGLDGGLFLAVFLAFMAEFWYRNKQKITG